MSSAVHSLTVELEDGSKLGPAWTLNVAVQVAHEAEAAKRKAVRIRRGAEVVLEGDALRNELDRLKGG